ncbi:hypothetical protein OESDEN_15444 [Oesophagostomum dentatum]|uniref:GOLD domain-containing protein n=1 Tax=Oesophagostomum dentatum TaxID=61180 RepID=A0A0B1SLR9_OESDE|nr:hypothetical protein OESDEN_15444 [Oesophagostomum dentatum]
MLRLLFKLLFLLPSSIASYGHPAALDVVRRSLTMDLESKMTCVYESLRANSSLNLNIISRTVHNTQILLRLTSPSGEYSEWSEGKDGVFVEHNATENGLFSIVLSFFFHENSR